MTEKRSRTNSQPPLPFDAGRSTTSECSRANTTNAHHRSRTTAARRVWLVSRGESTAPQAQTASTLHMHTHRPYYGDTPSNMRLHSCGNWREVAPSDVAMHHHHYTPGRKCVESSHAHVVVTLRTKMEPTSQWRHPSSTDKGVRLHTPQTALNTGNQSAVAYIAHGVTESQTPISCKRRNRSQSPRRRPHQQILTLLFCTSTRDARRHHHHAQQSDRPWAS